jgi:hypothetical protein
MNGLGLANFAFKCSSMLREKAGALRIVRACVALPLFVFIWASNILTEVTCDGKESAMDGSHNRGRRKFHS